MSNRIGSNCLQPDRAGSDRIAYVESFTARDLVAHAVALLTHARQPGSNGQSALTLVIVICFNVLHTMMTDPHRCSLILFFTLTVASTPGCKPDDSPFRAENDNLRKQLIKQESVVSSLQDGNKVMQEQINLLNQELRDARREAEKAVADAKAFQAESKALSNRLEAQLAETKKLASEVQRTSARVAQMSDNVRVEDKGAQVEDLPRPIGAVGKAAEEALARNGYHVKVSVKTDQRAVFVTERKISNPASLEVSGFRNQYVVSLQALPANVTRLSVKADFEKLVQGGRVLTVSAEETAEIERRLIAEINKAVAAPNKL